MSLLIGIPACAVERNQMPFHQTPARYAEAVLGGAGGVPVLVPPLGAAMLDVLDHLDGLLVPGSPSNVHPSHYDGGESETPDSHDLARDGTTLPLIRAAVARGVPVLAICRGIQELNVALGGSLFQRVHLQPARLDHRGGPGEPDVRYGPKHPIAVTGSLARILGADSIVVNSLHGQAIDRLADGLVVVATAPDGTIEAVAMPGAPGWLLGVQWHPEWRYGGNPHSLAILAAFGEACRIHKASNRKAA
ncbi:MAG TPA: gamma-glutamyl-gamma-aminobutyrate hydrolase family protein [Rhodopila sp.]|nr:gamma-glutamyl-gamma-aminobutyrate hydrolase family protein [Rhodopila sp.]